MSRFRRLEGLVSWMRERIEQADVVSSGFWGRACVLPLPRIRNQPHRIKLSTKQSKNRPGCSREIPGPGADEEPRSVARACSCERTDPRGAVESHTDGVTRTPSARAG